jgi:hypothetical protein
VPGGQDGGVHCVVVAGAGGLIVMHACASPVYTVPGGQDGGVHCAVGCGVAVRVRVGPTGGGVYSGV